jgi:hypothetical protein
LYRYAEEEGNRSLETAAGHIPISGGSPTACDGCRYDGDFSSVHQRLRQSISLLIPFANNIPQNSCHQYRFPILYNQKKNPGGKYTCIRSGRPINISIFRKKSLILVDSPPAGVLYLIICELTTIHCMEKQCLKSEIFRNSDVLR